MVLLQKDKKHDISQKLTSADHANDLVLLTNTPAQIEFLLSSLEQAARGIGLYINADK